MVGYEKARRSLVSTLGELQGGNCAGGNYTNVGAESEFTARTGLSLKKTYKPGLKRTLKRDHTLRWRNLENRRLYGKAVSDVFG